MQGNDRLARSRAAIDHNDSAIRRPDYVVLLPLQSRGGLAHPSRPGLTQRKDERAVTDDVLDRCCGSIQDLVAHIDDGAIVHAQVATAAQPQRRNHGGRVERPGGLRPPVHEQGLSGIRPQPDPTDMERFAMPHAVDASETQGPFRRTEQAHSLAQTRDLEIPRVEVFRPVYGRRHRSRMRGTCVAHLTVKTRMHRVKGVLFLCDLCCPACIDIHTRPSPSSGVNYAVRLGEEQR
ncbi:hypothetical protein ACX9R5_01625 [Rathayibacter sp. CAU 1779]